MRTTRSLHLAVSALVAVLAIQPGDNWAWGATPRRPNILIILADDKY
jgi:hypothetical protein